MVRERKVIVDTNVLYSALHKPQGVCGIIVQAAIDGLCQLSSTDSVREELGRNLVENLSMPEPEETRVVSALPVEWVPREAYEHKIAEAASRITHEEDAPVLALSLAISFPILSGDRHFRSARVMERANVLTPKQFLKILQSRDKMRRAATRTDETRRKIGPMKGWNSTEVIREWRERRNP